jgi:hypothetical protein
LLYGTTPIFLEHFALRHLEELPRADELAIALRVPGAPPTVRSGLDVDAPAGAEPTAAADVSSESPELPDSESETVAVDASE